MSDVKDETAAKQTASGTTETPSKKTKQKQTSRRAQELAVDTLLKRAEIPKMLAEGFMAEYGFTRLSRITPRQFSRLYQKWMQTPVKGV